MANNHLQGQRIRRAVERLTQVETVQDIVVDVVAGQQQQINALDARLSAVEQSRADR